jgi:NAD(P)-dependent dehydrogenase (short-subunit alcohol dehydrogenase family)
MSKLMTRKVVLITGGASGIGRATALSPAAEQAMLSVVPQGRWCEPAEVVVFLCSDVATHVTGHIMPVEGGWTAR